MHQIFIFNSTNYPIRTRNRFVLFFIDMMNIELELLDSIYESSMPPQKMFMVGIFADFSLQRYPLVST